MIDDIDNKKSCKRLKKEGFCTKTNSKDHKIIIDKIIDERPQFGILGKQEMGNNLWWPQILGGPEAVGHFVLRGLIYH